MVAEIKVVDVTGQRDGWDAADAEFRNWAEARAWLVPRVRVLDAPEPPPPPPAPPPEDLRDAAARASEHAAAARIDLCFRGYGLRTAGKFFGSAQAGAYR